MRRDFVRGRSGGGRRWAAGLSLSAFLLFWAILFAAARPSRADEAYGFILPQSGSQYLTQDDLAGMTPQLLCYARNEIFARNGRTFLSPELQMYFDDRYWYTPLYSPEQFSFDMLSSIEQANADLLLAAEEAAGLYETDLEGFSYEPVYAYLAQGSAGTAGEDPYYTDPDSYVFYGSDQQLLTEEEIASLSLQELCYARNEIYARRGMVFWSMELQDFFDQKNWYWGSVLPGDFSDELLSETERANAQALQAREYALSPSGYITDQPGYRYADVGSYAASGGGAGQWDEYIFRDSNIRYLTREEISRLSLQQINYARNEIYARRGYIFQSQELRDYFSSRSWYRPTIPSSQFSDSMFNEVEQANIRLLKECEYELDPNGYPLY